MLKRSTPKLKTQYVTVLSEMHCLNISIKRVQESFKNFMHTSLFGLTNIHSNIYTMIYRIYNMRALPDEVRMLLGQLQVLQRVQISWLRDIQVILTTV